VTVLSRKYHLQIDRFDAKTRNAGRFRLTKALYVQRKRESGFCELWKHNRGESKLDRARKTTKNNTHANTVASDRLHWYPQLVAFKHRLRLIYTRYLHETPISTYNKVNLCKKFIKNNNTLRLTIR